jgi:hypothetical protein
MPKTIWGRKETIIWPQNKPIYTYAAIFGGIALTMLFVYGWLRFLTGPLQWFYAPVYVRTSFFGGFSRTHRSEYRMLFLTGYITTLPGRRRSAGSRRSSEQSPLHGR